MNIILRLIALLLVLTSQLAADALVNLFGYTPQSTLSKHNAYKSLYNPSSILNMQEKWRFGLFQTDFNIDQQFINFGKELQDKKDLKVKDLLEIVESKVGKSYYLKSSFQSLSFAYRGDNFAFGAYPLGLVSSETSLHRGFSSKGMLNTKIMTATGGLANFAYSLADQIAFVKNIAFLNKIDLGLNLKTLQLYGFDERLTMADMLNNKNRFADYANDNLAKANFTSFDLASSIKFYDNFSLDLTALNLIALGKKEDALYIPTSFNGGASYTVKQQTGILDAYKLSLGFEDMSFAYEDKEFLKHLNAQAEAKLFKAKWFSTTGFIGLYQKALSAGFGLDLNLLNINYSTYVKTPRFAEQGARQHHLFVNLSF